MEGWRLWEGDEGVGEPMSVGGLVGMDGLEGMFCRLLLLGWDTDPKSVSSRARFRLFVMLGIAFCWIMRLNCEGRNIETSGILDMFGQSI